MRCSKYEMVNNYDGTWSIRVYSQSEKIWLYLKYSGHGQCKGVYTKGRKDAKVLEYDEAIKALNDLMAQDTHLVDKITITMV